jgi:expansin (peptidoglycan-binding protein)
MVTFLLQLSASGNKILRVYVGKNVGMWACGQKRGQKLALLKAQAIQGAPWIFFGIKFNLTR